jgi:isopenicillin N synthase-like dioxygenase
MSRSIPSLSLAEFEYDKRGFAERLGTAYQEYGFVGLTNHGVPDTTIAECYTASKTFFAQTTAIKMQYDASGVGGARGYTGFGVEGAKDQALGDLKEFWHFGRDLPAGHPYRTTMPDNKIVTELPDFNARGMALYHALEKAGHTVLAALALYLGEDEGFFTERSAMGNSVLRIIHYPPITDLEPPAVRAGAHEDINLITLLVGSGEPGLEVLARDGEWVPIDTIPGTIVCNIGDMLQRFTNDVLPSTTHRVVNPTGSGRLQPRYSMPFFQHLNPDVVIEPLASCVTPTRPSRYPHPITANDYLTVRLYEIGLIKDLPDHLQHEVADTATAGSKAQLKAG